MKDINATVLVNIKPSKEKIFENLHKDARWGINKAKKEGLIVEEVKDDLEWIEFYKIYRKIMIEGGATPESIEELKKMIAVLFICKKDKMTIAGAGIGFGGEYDAKIPQLKINASLREYLNLQPNNFLYWHCILWCKEKGYEKFDLGGWQINASGHLEGVNNFKERWGELIYYYKDYSFIKAVGRKLIRNSKIFWWLNKKLKGRR